MITLAREVGDPDEGADRGAGRPAVESAVRQRASFVEVDIQRSADGELVVVHDVTLTRSTDAEEVFPDRAPWRVGDFTLAELRQLDAGSWFADDFAGELSSIRGYLRSALARDLLVVQSFNHASMRIVHDSRPDIPIGLLYGYRPTEAELVAASGWAEQVNPSYRVTDAELVDRVHELGMTISVYTINTGQLMREYIGLGVDGIITDYPSVLREILQER